MNFRLLKMLNRSYRSPAPVTYLSTNLSPDLPTSYLSTYPQYPARPICYIIHPNSAFYTVPGVRTRGLGRRTQKRVYTVCVVRAIRYEFYGEERGLP